jgi:glutamate-1-semialdehyde 2,1-aminomutase
LAEVKRLTHAAGALLIFDEVITAFRFHYGAAAELLGVIPDLYALGKIIGGGLPAGAYGGRREVMEMVSPLGKMFQAGTFAGNPVASAAGLATLAVLREENPYPRMDQLADQLVRGIEERARAHAIAITINRAGSGFTVFFGSTPVVDYTTAQQADESAYAQFHRLMLEHGVYLAPSRFEAWFVSAAHTRQDIEQTLDAVEQAFSVLAG